MTLLETTLFDEKIFVHIKILSKYGMISFGSFIMISGIISAFGWALGPVIGGQFLVQQCKKPRGAMKLVVILSIFTLGCYTLLMLLSCPKQEFAGVVTTSE